MSAQWSVHNDDKTTVSRHRLHPDTVVIVIGKGDPNAVLLQGHVDTIARLLEEWRFQVLELEQQMILEAAQQAEPQ